MQVLSQCAHLHHTPLRDCESQRGNSRFFRNVGYYRHNIMTGFQIAVAIHFNRYIASEPRFINNIVNIMLTRGVFERHKFFSRASGLACDYRFMQGQCAT